MFPEETFCWKTHVDLEEERPLGLAPSSGEASSWLRRWDHDQRETLEG